MPKDYTKTLNLPQTDFSMRANLTQKEPEMLEKWKGMDLYNEIQKKNAGKPKFVLHDGPPFSNGNIHMGTALNKILKDMIIKNKSMTGYSSPFIPGWDNHGMPIESAIIKQNKLDRKKMSIAEFRDACMDFAQRYVDIQLGSFVRLGVLGDWEHPYKTMSFDFEAREVKVFGEMFKKGYIYKGLKPVYWCPIDETALAEAEIEYKEDKCTSVFVKFKLAADKGLLDGVCDKEKVSFVIWTTTIWTLPGNLAIAVHPRESYVLVKANGEYLVVAKDLCESVMAAGGISEFETIKEFSGQDLEFMEAYHPFLDRKSVVINADYVTMDSGTGCVHIAPGFGADDYNACKKYGIDIIVPVDDKGYQTELAGKYAGMHYSESNTAIFNDMKESGALFAFEEIVHTYPHCWRCKNPIIFRATPQWFCSVKEFKNAASKACEDVTWMPAWGKDRIQQMIEDRADWCISRQRHWGLPIPVFYCDDCKKPVCTDETISKVSEIFAKEGSNAWYKKEAAELIPEGFVCPHCGGKHFTKETDTLDGWFDSGSSHFAVLENSEEMSWPCDLYLEGADQYRGWFQSSLLCAVGAKDAGAPYKAVLTHGWVVDGEGKAMHKSLGNSIYPEDMIKKYGADLVRLWAASSDYRVDVRASENIFKQLCEAYRKIRNTARIILANLGKREDDFDPDRDLIAPENMTDIDKWAISEFNKLVAVCRKAYDEYEFHIVCHEVNNFCTVTMSKLYIDITKDRLYVEAKDSYERRSTQSALYFILDALTKLIAPVLSFTADEIWLSMPHTLKDDARNVFLNDMPSYDEALTFTEINEHYNKLFDLRDHVMKALEIARADKMIGKSLDAEIVIYAKGESKALLESFGGELASLFIVSGAEISDAEVPAQAYTDEASDISVLVKQASGTKCDRCWSFVEKTYADEDGVICERCKNVLGL